MKIYTDNLTRQDLFKALPRGVYLDVMEHGSRKRKRAFDVALSTDHGTRRRNSSTETTGDFAASWDEWGMFLAALFALDSEAIMGVYKDASDFTFKTGGHYGDGSKPLPVDCPNHKWELSEPWQPGQQSYERICAKGCGAIQRWTA